MNLVLMTSLTNDRVRRNNKHRVSIEYWGRGRCLTGFGMGEPLLVSSNYIRRRGYVVVNIGGSVISKDMESSYVTPTRKRRWQGRWVRRSRGLINEAISWI
ncbi:hypothetical protein L6452_27185 [Arctium lappa]|uniref:Uncharacterized protein n=1 Tax=Arctium lappa TaxID=4217 RepID=A0ACB8ZWS7_ARCLA|nr:hypothetical protein L6452_27185 [Arctium lappa]